MVIYTNFRGMHDAQDQFGISRKNFSEKVDGMRSTITETTVKDWKGPDADAFVNSTTEKLDKVSTTYEEYLTALRNEIGANVNKFKNVQQRNIDMID